MQRSEKTPDYFATSNPTDTDLRVDINHRLFDMVYLVSGTHGAPVPDPNKTAIDTVAEFLLNQLSEGKVAQGAEGMYLSTSMISNLQQSRTAKMNNAGDILYTQEGIEKPGVCGEDNFSYNAIGVASATVPEQTVKCYSVAKIMRTVFGRKDGFAAPEGFKGFREDALASGEAAGEIAALLKYTPAKVEAEIKRLCEKHIQWPEGFQNAPHKDILAGINSQLDKDLQLEKKKAVIIKEMNAVLDTALSEYWDAMRTFLINYGPHAYCEMVAGTGPDGQHYAGSINEKLGDYQETGVENLTAINTKRTKDDLKAAYDKVHTPIVGGSKGFISGWHGAYIAHKRMEVALEVANYVFTGTASAYRKRYLDEIRNYSAWVSDFDFTLTKLSYVYENMGENFGSYDKFLEAAKNENATNVNVIADQSDYQWAKGIVDSHARSLDFVEIKEKIVDSFLHDHKAWTEYDSMHKKETPRRALDAIMAPFVDLGNDLSIISYINYKLANGADMGVTIKKLVSDLAVAATPLYHAHANLMALLNGSSFGYLLAPKALFLEAGGADIQASFAAACQTLGVTLVPCTIGDRLVYYMQYAALPMYALADLQTWQNVYDNTTRVMIHANESGKGIYDREDGLAWEDYPALALTRNPRLPDPATGRVSREGQFFEKLDDFFDKAMKKGVIKENHDPDNKKYSYSCFILDKPGWNYEVKLDDYDVRNADGCYVIGEPVFAYLAEKNKSSLQEIEQKVALQQQGSFNDPTEDQDVAKDRAKRALRRNVPQYIGIKRTLKLWEGIVAKLEEENQRIRAAQASKYLPYYIATGILAPTKKQWDMHNYPVTGKDQEVISLNPVFLDSDDSLVANGYYYELLCRAFIDKLADNADISTFYKPLWKLLGVEPETYAPEFKQRMEPFYKEATDFMGQAENASVSVQRNLMETLNLKGEAGLAKLEEMKTHYQRFLNVYKLVIGEMPEE